MARVFNGSTDQIASVSNLPTNIDPITMSVWLNYTSRVPAVSSVCGPNAAGIYCVIQLKSTGHLAYYVKATAGVSVDPGTALLSASTWYHAVLAFDSVGGLRTYVNAVSDGTAAGGAASTVGGSPMAFGYDPGNAGRNFAGSIADGAIWQASLTALEILSLYRGARPRRIRPLSFVGWWPLDGIQSPEPDLSGKANNGTLTGTSLAFGPPFAPFTPRFGGFGR